MSLPGSRDPGWRAAWSGIGRGFAASFRSKARRRRSVTDGLTGARIIFLSLLACPFLFLIVILSRPRGGGGEPLAMGVVVAAGLVSMILTSWALRRPLIAATPTTLAGTWRARWFIGIAAAEMPALFGVAWAIASGNPWAYVVGLAFSLFAFWRIAPSRRNLTRDQEQIRERGSSLDLTAALMQTAGPPRPDVPE